MYVAFGLKAYRASSLPGVGKYGPLFAVLDVLDIRDIFLDGMFCSVKAFWNTEVERLRSTV